MRRAVLSVGLVAGWALSAAAEPGGEIARLLAEAERVLVRTHPGGDPAAALGLLREAAELGSPVARLRAAQVAGRRGGDEWVKEPTGTLVAQVARLAAAGDLTASGVLGTSYLLAVGVEEDAARAAQLYEASMGDYAWSAHNLGWMYSVGKGVPESMDHALDLWRASAPTNPYSRYSLATLYLNGDRVPLDEDHGLAQLRQAAASGHVAAGGELGAALCFGFYGLRIDVADGRALLLNAAEHGLHVAMFNLGYLHHQGPESVRDLRAARSWFERCAGGDPRCDNSFGHMLVYGRGGPQRVDAGIDHLLAAVEGGDLFAFGHLADLQGVVELTAEQNGRIRRALEQGAAAGNPNAQGGLARMLWDGSFGSEIDTERAFEAASLGSEGGSAHAMKMLAMLYWNGVGTEVDRRSAVAWWQRSAEAGDRHAAYQLADKYLRGNGVAKDREAGVAWLERSAAHGWGPAHTLLAEMHEYGWFETQIDLAVARARYEQAAALGNFLAIGWLRASEELGD